MVAAIEPPTIQGAILQSWVLYLDEAVEKVLEEDGKKEEMADEPRCGGTDHYKSACPKLNRAPRQGGNYLNQVLAIKGGQGRRNNGNLACGRAFVMGVEKAHQDPNIVTGMFSLNNHYATMLFDSGADYNFISTTFIPLLVIKPSSLGLSYKIEIASGQLVEINKVIRDYKLEIEEEKVKNLMSAKAEEQKLKDITVVRNFFEVFPDDLSGLPPSQEIEFHIDLIPGAMPVTKSAYHLEPTEMEEFSSTYYRTPDKGFIRQVPCIGETSSIHQEEGRQEGYEKASKCDLRPAPEGETVHKSFQSTNSGCREVAFPWHVFNSDGIHTLRSDCDASLPKAWVRMMQRENCICSQDLETLLVRDEEHYLWWIKMYYDLRDMYWWPGIKKDIALCIRDMLGYKYDFHTQTDGQSDLTIQTLEDMLKAGVIDFGGSWDVHLPLVEFSYNNSYVHRSKHTTGESTAHPSYGQKSEKDD
ncbi:putative reverse transcriptase domain-containing protein [Tanacetum coccineum]